MFNISKLEELRDESRMTQSEFAEKLGMTRNGYQGLLKHKDPKISTLIAIAKVCKVSMAVFFDDNEFDDLSKEKLSEKDSKIVSLEEKNELLNKRVSDLEKIIRLMEEKK